MRLMTITLAGFLAIGCGAASPSPMPTAPPETASVPPGPATTPPTPSATTLSTPTAAAFATEAFAAISGDPVSTALAAELQSILDTTARDDPTAGISATLMSARGTWSGVTGNAAGDREVTIHDQFSIASTTKAITAAQVMQLIEAGALGLDDPAADHLPSDLDFDTNGATIRDLLGHRSGIPDYVSFVPELLTDPLRVWTPSELLASIPADRKPAGVESDYANTNYLLLGLVIEEVTGRPVIEVLRDGVLAIDGVERLIYQPDEKPTEPIAVEYGRSTDYLESVGGFLPSLALTSDRTAAAMASDSVSLARWWRALCAGEIVSQASLTEMMPTDDWYGLGLGKFDPPGTVGHYGQDLGGVSLAGCVPEDGIVYAVLANRHGSVVHAGAAGPLIDALRPG